MRFRNPVLQNEELFSVIPIHAHTYHLGQNCTVDWSSTELEVDALQLVGCGMEGWLDWSFSVHV